MKQINQLIPQAQNNVQIAQQEQIKQTAKSLEHYTTRIDRLFNRLKPIFTAWKVNMPTPDHEKSCKALWTRLIAENGLTDEQIMLGLEKAEHINGKWWPNPNEFVSWCLESPEIENLPTLDQSYCECRKNAYKPAQSEWTHDLVYWSGYGMWHYLKETTNDRPNSQFKTQYEQAVKAVKNGTLKPIPKHSEVLEDKSDKAVTPKEKKELKETGNNTLKELMGKL